MIKLENIKMKNNVISALVTTVETNPQKFEISVDINKEKLTQCTRETRDTYVYMVMAKLIQLHHESNKLPEKAESVWY